MQKTVTRRDEERRNGDGSKSRRPLTRRVGSNPTFSARKSPKRAYACLGDFLVHSISTQKRRKNTIYSILARGYLFHDKNGNVLDVNPKCKIDLARRALLAWCSIPDSKKATPKEEWQ